MAINWPSPKQTTQDLYYQEYMGLPIKTYPRVPKNGLVDTALQEQKLSDLDAAGYPNDNSSLSPSTTEREPSAVSKRKTIFLNERAKPNISTTEKNPTTSLFMDEAAYHMDEAAYQQQLIAALEYLARRQKEREKMQAISKALGGLGE